MEDSGEHEFAPLNNTFTLGEIYSEPEQRSPLTRTPYRRADTVVDKDVADDLAEAVRVFLNLGTQTNIINLRRHLAAYEEATKEED